ncbi:hypothetical protein ACFVMC_30510 [Nocardia sp. NPDC127579]|uniref:hypothetical protein n=1 Tax=Nocardia sp. NPDC127579 TaxID=3345402 RepID=UPI00362D6E9D
MQSQEGKWRDAAYLSVGDRVIAADDLLTFLCLVFLLVAGLLGYGAVLLLRGKLFGRFPLLVGAWAVVIGQLFAGVLAAIPIDAFHYSAPPSLVFVTPAVLFPMVTILFLVSATPISRERRVFPST